jgi:hypothetical protein
MIGDACGVDGEMSNVLMMDPAMTRVRGREVGCWLLEVLGIPC